MGQLSFQPFNQRLERARGPNQKPLLIRSESLRLQFRLWRRDQEFHEHLVRAQNAATRERYDEAVREYTAALRIQPGDPEALLGRAHARK